MLKPIKRKTGEELLSQYSKEIDEYLWEDVKHLSRIDFKNMTKEIQSVIGGKPAKAMGDGKEGFFAWINMNIETYHTMIWQKKQEEEE